MANVYDDNYSNIWIKNSKDFTTNELIEIQVDKNELQQIEDYINKGEAIDIMDIGPGLGGEALCLYSKGYNIHLYDIDLRFIFQINKRKKDLKLPKNLFYYNGDITKYNLPNNKFDCIFISNVFHFIDFFRIAHFCKMLKNCLKEKGLVIIRAHSTKHPYNHELSEKRSSFKHFFHTSDINALFEGSDFEIIINEERKKTFTPLENKLQGKDENKKNEKYYIFAILKLK